MKSGTSARLPKVTDCHKFVRVFSAPCDYSGGDMLSLKRLIRIISLYTMTANTVNPQPQTHHIQYLQRLPLKMYCKSYSEDMI